MKHPQDVDISLVTSEQIGRCHKIFDPQAKVFYAVESESEPGAEYHVRHSEKHGFTCTCKAGWQGFTNCKDSYCKHVRWSVAAAMEEQFAIAEMAAAQWQQACEQQKTQILVRLQAQMRSSLLAADQPLDEPSLHSILKASQQPAS